MYVRRSWVYLFRCKEKYTNISWVYQITHKDRIFKYNLFKSKTEFKCKLYKTLCPMNLLPYFKAPFIKIQLLSIEILYLCSILHSYREYFDEDQIMK